MLFQLRFGEVGIYGYGRCWYLTMLAGQQKNPIYTFYTKDDGHGCSKNCSDGKLWTNMDDILENANAMIFDMTTP